MVSTHDVTVSDSVVVKRFRSADCDEPEREWRALRILAEHAPGFAPEPISFSAHPPVITMSLVPGQELHGALNGAELSALAAAIERLHAVPVDAIAPDAGSDPAAHIARTRDALPATVEGVDDVVAGAVRAGHAWLSGPDPVALRRDDPPPVLARLDYNLANFLYDGESVRMLDFEDSCRADRGIELAFMIEHISARDTPDSAWLALCDSFGLRPDERRRFVGMRRSESLFWLALLLPGGRAAARNPPEMLRAQAQRVLALL